MIEVISNNGKRCTHEKVYMMVIARMVQIKGGEERKENDLFPQGRDGERPEEVDRPMRSCRRSSGDGETFYSAVPTFRPGAVQ